MKHMYQQLQHCTRISNRLLCFSLFLVTILYSLDSTATLLVTPSRVVFEDRTRTAQVTLVNKGTETTTYRISFIRQNMTEDGKFVPVAKGEEGLYADELVRFSPRQVVLQPGQSQIVRLMLRKPRGLADGEYRSHMLMQALPKTTKSDISRAVQKSGNEISVEITTIVGISIPVIVRNGKLNAEVTLSKAALVKSADAKQKPFLELDIVRSGTESVYGDFRVTYKDEKGKSEIVGNVNGVAVYFPNKLRHFQIPLDFSDGSADYSSGQFHISYIESGKDEATGLIAETDLKL